MKNITKHIYLITVLLAGMITIGCSDDNPELSQVAIFVTPGLSTNVTLSSGEKAKYTMDISTINDYVAALKITSFDRFKGETVWVDQTFDQKHFEYNFIYTAPQFESETTQITLTFTVTDNKGNTASVKRDITVINKIVSLAERTGIVLYAPSTGLADALSLSDVARPFNLADSPAPEQADIYMVANEDFSVISWLSNTNTKFLRNNTFNYVEATAASITSVYSSSTRQDNVTDLRVNDIILVGHGMTAEGVFMVTNVIRTPGLPNCIQLNYKGIGRSATEVDTPSDTEEEK